MEAELWNFIRGVYLLKLLNQSNPTHDFFSPLGPTPKKKEHKMANAQANSTITLQTREDESLQYLSYRLRDIYRTSVQKINEKFEDPRPSSKKELLDWLQSGNYRIDKEVENDGPCFYWRDIFHWGKAAPDYKERNKLLEQLEGAYENTKDIVHVCSDEQVRLKALQDFQATWMSATT